MSEEVPKKKRGRPPLPGGMMQYVTLRVLQTTLDHGASLVARAEDWPEFRRNAPNRSAILRLAMNNGLEELSRRQVGYARPEGYTARPEVDDLREMSLSLKRDVDMVNKMEELRKVVLALQKDIESLKQKGSE